MKKYIIIVQILFFFTISTIAQVTQEWVRLYDGPASKGDIEPYLTIDASGNVYVTGCSTGLDNNGDFVTIKYNASGVQQWVARYNGTGNREDYSAGIAIDNSGNVYITGRSYNANNYDYATIKYNSSGIQQWVAIYNGPGNGHDYPKSIAVDASGNVCVTGYCRMTGSNDDFVTIKYNSNGVQQWLSSYNGTANNADYAASVAVDFQGNSYVFGASMVTFANYDFCLIKYNSSGVQQWIQFWSYLSTTSEMANEMILDKNGNIYLTGGSGFGGGGTNWAFATVKYNSNGVIQWSNTYNPYTNQDISRAIGVDLQGNVYVTGESILQASYFDYATIKYDSSGTQQWIQRYNSPSSGEDRAYDLAVDKLGNVYVTGSYQNSSSWHDFATIKYNTQGVLQWEKFYNGPANGWDVGLRIAVDTLFNVYVNGVATIIPNINEDIATIKYSQPIGIQTISSEIPESFSLSQNYPNPFNPSTVISFKLAVNSYAKIIVYDILGNEISTLVNERLKAGTYEAEWDGSNFSSGVYYYKLIAGDFVETRKMILVK
jgi:uncharacterized delta-60 repeat protein